MPLDLKRLALGYGESHPLQPEQPPGNIEAQGPGGNQPAPGVEPRPDQHVIDIDPPEPAGVVPAAAAAGERRIPRSAIAAKLALGTAGIAGLSAIVLGVESIKKINDGDVALSRKLHSGSMGALSSTIVFAVAQYVALRYYDRARQAGIQAGIQAARRERLDRSTLNQAIRDFCDPETPAARMDWAQPRLFVNGEDVKGAKAQDVGDQVALVFKDFIKIARQDKTAGRQFQDYLNDLATNANFRKDLASMVVDAAAACEYRSAVSLSQVMMSRHMEQIRRPDADPKAVVQTLLIRAAQEGMNQFVSDRVRNHPDRSRVELELELRLLAVNSVQSALRNRGLDTPAFFPQNDGAAYLDNEDKALITQRAENMVNELFDQSTEPGIPHGGKAYEHLSMYDQKTLDEIIYPRISHLIHPEHRRILKQIDKEIENASGDHNPLDTVNSLKKEYDKFVETIYKAALEGALTGDDQHWSMEKPVESSDSSDSDEEGIKGEQMQPADKAIEQAPEGYDPRKGKWPAESSS